MKQIVKKVYFVLSLLFLLYLLLPKASFPNPPSDALQSIEPGDTETSLRRAYYTNYNRSEVMDHYVQELSNSQFSNLPLPTYRLNYPPEEAQTIIRDQTQSTFLEEIVHPLRESFFVNGFEPKEDKDTIIVAGSVWRQKITVRYIPSSAWTRLLLGFITLALISLLIKSWKETIINLKRQVLK